MNRPLTALATSLISACRCGAPELVDVDTFCSFETGATLACERNQACGWVSPHIVCAPSWNARSQMRLVLCPENPEASLDAGRIRFDGARAAACLREASLACQPLDSCSAAVVGLVPQGGACSTTECAAGLTCDTSTCPSTCQPFPCPGQQRLVDGGCGPFTRMGVSLGGACSESSPCDEQLRCLQGRCVWNRAQEGAACDTTFVTERWCQEGLFCVGGRCSRGAAPGEKCSTNDLCRVDSFCGLDGGCVLPPHEGAACVEGQCASPLSCSAGTCRQSPSAGTRCVVDQDCGGTTLLRCESGRCAGACR